MPKSNKESTATLTGINALDCGIRDKFKHDKLTSNLLLLDVDINQMLEIFGVKERVSTLELTTGNVSQTISLRLGQSPDRAFTAPLLLKIDGGHWVRALVLVGENPASGKREVRVRYSDSANDQSTGNLDLTAGIKTAIGDCDVCYEKITGEFNKQNDAWSSGYRALKSLLDDAEFPYEKQDTNNFPLKAFRAIKAPESTSEYSAQLEGFVYRYLLAVEVDDEADKNLHAFSVVQRLKKIGINVFPNPYEILNRTSVNHLDWDIWRQFVRVSCHRNDHYGRAGGKARLDLADAIVAARGGDFRDFESNLFKLDYFNALLEFMAVASRAVCYSSRRDYPGDTIDELEPSVRSTINLINCLASESYTPKQKLDFIRKYEIEVASRPLSKSVWQAIKGIIFAAVGFVIGVSIGSVALGSAVALTTAGVFAHRYRKTNVEKCAPEIVATARRYLLSS